MSAKRILIVRFSAIGDCVMAAWPVTGLRQAYPDATIVWAVQSRCLPVIATPQLAIPDEIYKDEWAGNGTSPKSHWFAQVRHFLSLRKHKFDYGFDLHGHFKTALCLKLSGAQHRIASRSTDPFSGRFNPVLPTSESPLHEVELGAAAIRHFLPIDLPESPIMPEVATGRRYDVLIQTGAGQEDKRLPLPVVSTVAESLAGQGFKVALIGAPGDPDPEIPGVTSHVGRATLPETMSLICSARMHIGGDTGTGHIAAAYNIPTVTVFGRTDPVRFRPWGKHGTVLQHGTSMRDVTAEQVLTAAQAHMEALQSARS